MMWPVAFTRVGRARGRAAALAPTTRPSAEELVFDFLRLVSTRTWARLGRALLGDPDERAIDTSLPLALEGTARGLRAGASLRDALADVARTVPDPLRAELGAIARDAEQGGSLTEALDRWGAHRRQTRARPG